jgi:transposase-like protein
MVTTNFKNLVEFQQYFKDEETCRKHLAKARWDGVPVCPFCQSERIICFSDGKRFKCREKTCNKKFTVTVGTIYENSKIPLQKWFLAMYLIGNHKKGISSCQLARDLGVTQKTAWFINHRIREMHTNKSIEKLETVVQIDESFIGGKNKNRHWDKKIPHSQGRSNKDKAPVLGAISLSGSVKLQVIPNTKAASIEPLIKKWVKEGSIMVTDDWEAYAGLGEEFLRVVIDHSNGEYVKGGFTTNNIENFWSLFKRGIFGIYHQVSKEHLQRYCEEFAFRFNSRKIKDVERFEHSLTKCEGRLTYKRLISKGKTTMLKVELSQ